VGCTFAQRSACKVFRQPGRVGFDTSSCTRICGAARHHLILPLRGRAGQGKAKPRKTEAGGLAPNFSPGWAVVSESLYVDIGHPVPKVVCPPDMSRITDSRPAHPKEALDSWVALCTWMWRSALRQDGNGKMTFIHCLKITMRLGAKASSLHSCLEIRVRGEPSATPQAGDTVQKLYDEISV
jgi:hypothetical protein